MKKLLLACMMLFATSFGLVAGAMHVPAAGPVQLGDAVNGQHQGVLRGAIMKAIIDNNPINQNTNPILAAANAAIAQFDGQGQHFRSYQAIMTNISQSTNTQAAIAAVQAFENVIMHLYDYDAYMIGGYKSGLSIFVPTGIRWSWVNPLNYFSPKSYFSDNDARLKQLIDELDKLADVVKIHSKVEYARIKATVHSFRHWRRNTMLAIAAYLAGDICNNGYEKSIINQFYQGGLENAGEMAVNHVLNIYDAGKYVGLGLYKTAAGLCKVGGKACGVILHGKKAFEKNNDQPKVDDKKTNNNSVGACLVPDPKVLLMVTDKKATVQHVSVGVQAGLQNQSMQEKTAQEKKEPEIRFESIGNMIAYQLQQLQKRKEIWNQRLQTFKNICSGPVMDAQYKSVQEKIQKIETNNQVAAVLAKKLTDKVQDCLVQKPNDQKSSSPQDLKREKIKDRVVKAFVPDIKTEYEKNQKFLNNLGKYQESIQEDMREVRWKPFPKMNKAL